MKRPTRDIVSCLIGLVAVAPVAAAELRFTPTFALTEDITDNANETHSHRRAELLTVVQPGVGVNYLNSSSELNVLYQFDYRYYAEKTRSSDISHTLNLAGSFALVQQYLRLDVSDVFSRVSLDVARDTTAESGYHDQTDQNSVTISPYLQWRMGEKTELKAGGRYTDTRYWSDAAVDRQQIGAFAELSHQVSSRLTVNGSYVFLDNKTKSGAAFSNTTSIGRYRDHSATAGFRYEYADRSFISGSAGNSWQHFSRKRSKSYPIWDAALSKQFDTALATLETKRRYVEDPLSASLLQTTHSFRIDKLLKRSTVGLSASYNDYVAPYDPLSNRHGVIVSGTGTRELGPNLTSSLTLTGDWLSRRNSVDYPYHLTATGTLLYMLGPKSNVDLTYTYATYRYKPGQASGSVDVNRVVVQLKRTF